MSNPESSPTPHAHKTPKELLQIMIRLQRLDQERDKNTNLLRTAAELVKSRERELEKKRADQKRAEDDLITEKKAADASELELKSKAANIQKIELQLGTARTNQEYQALATHVQKLKAEVSREEDVGLAHYDKISAAEKRVATARAVVVKADLELKEYAEVCRRDSEQAIREIASTEPKRSELLESLPADHRATYEKIRGAREGIAIIALDGRNCGGCGVLCTPNEVQKLVSCTSIVTCKSCQRILYSTAAVPYV